MTSVDPQQAVSIMTSVDRQQAVSIMTSVDPQQAVSIMTSVDSQQAVSIMSSVDPPTASRTGLCWQQEKGKMGVMRLAVLNYKKQRFPVLP